MIRATLTRTSETAAAQDQTATTGIASQLHYPTDSRAASPLDSAFDARLAAYLADVAAYDAWQQYFADYAEYLIARDAACACLCNRTDATGQRTQVRWGWIECPASLGVTHLIAPRSAAQASIDSSQYATCCSADPPFDGCTNMPDICAPLTMCTASQFQAVAPDATHDRQCANLTPCLPGQVHGRAGHSLRSRIVDGNRPANGHVRSRVWPSVRRTSVGCDAQTQQCKSSLEVDVVRTAVGVLATSRTAALTHTSPHLHQTKVVRRQPERLQAHVAKVLQLGCAHELFLQSSDTNPASPS